MIKLILLIVFGCGMFIIGFSNGYSRSNSDASEVHKEENRPSSVEVDIVARERDWKSDKGRDQIKDEVMELFESALASIKKEVAQLKEKDYN